jgi:outer membrane receptor protein involved in Fe transport
MLFSYDLARARETNAVRGRFTLLEGLGQLLRDTGLSGGLSEKRVVIIAEKGNMPAGKGESVKKRGQLAGFVAAILGFSANGVRADQQSIHDSPPKIGEIVVTAQKIEERLIDTPLSVTVLSDEMLAQLGATQFRDFANTVPGLSFVTGGAGFTQIALRGITTGSADVAPTVAIYVDEVPYGSNSSAANGVVLALDVGLFDIDRIEVLRGPQGTLYGASSMGGLIKYVGKQPDTERFQVEGQFGMSDTSNGDASYNGAVALNAPLGSGKAALRTSGYYSRDGGFIDNITLGQENVNKSDIYGGRLDLLIAPNDALRVHLGGFVQDISRDGSGTSDYTFAGQPINGSLEQDRKLGEPFDQKFRLIGGTVTYEMDAATLTSISSYQKTDSDYVADLSAAFVPLLQLLLNRSYSAVGFGVGTDTDKFVQEIRLASNGSKPLEWLIGGYYAHEKSEVPNEFVLLDQNGEAAPNDLFSTSGLSRYEETAAFTNLTYNFTDKFNLRSGPAN